jgi:ribosomal protein S18 acetylase RimI-like enzyme
LVNFKIRNVVEEDFVAISHIAEDCSPMTTERNSIYHIFTKFFKSTSLVLEDTDDKSIKGFLLGFISPDDPQNAYIHLLCLDKSLRGSGIGFSIVDHFISLVYAMGSKKISLICKPHNEIAIKFYKKMGFISESTDKTVQLDGLNVYEDYDGPGEDKIVFYKLI